MKLHLKLLAAFGAVSFCLQASATTFPIADGDVAALKTAITTSNSNGANDTIELAANGTYTLTVVDNVANGLPVIGSDTSHQLTIQGNGATIQRSSAGGTPAFRIFSIGSGADVTISGLTITNGLTNSGAGILNFFGTLNVTNCTIAGNTASDTTSAVAGGIENTGGTLNVTDSTVSGNAASCGGFSVSCNSFAGGIDNVSGGTVNVTNSTFSGNSVSCSASFAPNCSALGGAFYNNDTLNLTNSTIADSSASCSGPGCSTQGGGILTQGTTTLESTILANSTGGDIVRNTGTVNAQYSLIEDGLTSVNGTNTNNLTGDPNLGPLQDNGGPTQTHAPLPDSPAIDQGMNFSVSNTDQRGFCRTLDLPSVANAGDGTDIGAVEVQFQTLNPNDFASLGPSPFFVNGTYTVITSGATPQLRDPNNNLIALGVVSNGMAVFTFDTITTGPLVTVSGAQDAGSRPLALLSHGSVTINGAINLSGATGLDGTVANGGNGGNAAPGGGGGGGGADSGGINGGSGGSGFVNGSNASNATGGGGGSVGDVGTTGGGGGGLQAGGGGGGGFGGSGGGGGTGGGSTGGSSGGSYGDLAILLQGGSGGGGGGGVGFGGAGGGGGAGAVEIGALGNITIAGAVLANGGNGGVSLGQGGGGGGSGGGILLHATAVSLSGATSLSTTGGGGGNGQYLGGGGGGGGRVLILTADGSITGDLNTMVNVAGGGAGTGSIANGVSGNPGVKAVASADCSENSPPDAVDDSPTVAEDSGANMIDVLGNDTDPDNDSLSVTAVTQGANGSVAITNSGANVSYTPNANFNGADSFTYTISDGNGGSDTATVNVNVTAANDPPTITAATGITRQQAAGASNSSIATVNDIEDNENNLSVTANGSSSATVNGVTVSNIAVDSLGNVTADVAAACGATNASFTLRVTDSGASYSEATLNVTVTAETTPPVINSISASPNLLRPPNHTLRLVTVSVSASDNCDPSPVCNIISVTSNEPDNGCGSGDQPNDIQSISGLTVKLRAERCGTLKTGRIYTITVRCTDASGNASIRTTTVKVNK